MGNWEDGSFYNESDFDYDLVEPCSYQNNHSVEQVLGPCVHSIIFILGFLGNGLVILTYVLYKRTRSMTDVYLLNVAVADLLFVTTLPLIVYNEHSSWSMGALACKLLRGSYSVNLYSGVLLLACISTDRYVAIVQARRSVRLRSQAYGRLVCVAVWTLAVLLSIPTFLSYHRYEPSHSQDSFLDEGHEERDMNRSLVHEERDMNRSLVHEERDMNRSLVHEVRDRNRTLVHNAPQYVCEFSFPGASEASVTKVAVPSVQLAVGFFLPLLVMIFCYSAVVATLLKTRTFQRHRAVRVVLVVVVAFVACRLPYSAALLHDTVVMFDQEVCEVSDALQTAKTLTQTLAYLQCCLNPLLYAFVGQRFRNHFRRILRELCCWGRSQLGTRRCSVATSEVNLSTRRSLDGDTGSSFTM